MEAIAASEITMLNNLDVSINDYIIKVRILRKWKQPDRKYPNEDYSIETILIDEEGNKIHGHVLKKWFFRFEKYLNESDCLLIKRPSLGINLSKYKFVDNPNKVNFNYQTYVSKCNDFVGQEHGFSFSSFQNVKDNLLPENITIDVIGHVAKFFNKDSQSLNEEKNKTRITMQLHDLQGCAVFLTLWDHYATQMFKYMSKHKMDEHVVVILQFARVKFFNGNPYVSNSFGSEVCRLFINDEVDDIIKYKKRLYTYFIIIIFNTLNTNLITYYYFLTDEFLTNTAFTNIGEICEIFEVKCVVIMGTIKAISKDICWYYMACERCNRKVGTKDVTRFKEDGSGDFEDEKVSECNNAKCNVKVVSPVPRY
ncbi:hypothetical protein E3N88_23116 [Mikania micrantha]|uniref:Uncharacterized protein n=1 Tax=Mikania micrantha TaxID=192012 RepID=A0A5N6NF13_9ASTR|nr:hypothetical protein E3N88_23116 [Mikania micrantha]